MHNRRNITRHRPRPMQLSPQTWRRLEDLNRHDTALYHWVRQRFAEQTAGLGNAFARECRRFSLLNAGVQTASRLLPRAYRRRVLKALLYA